MPNVLALPAFQKPLLHREFFLLEQIQCVEQLHTFAHAQFASLLADMREVAISAIRDDIILWAALSPKRVRQVKIRIPETHVLFLRLYIFHDVTGCRRRRPKVSLKKVHSG